MKLLTLNNTVIGIDIGSRHLKAVKIKKGLKGFKVVQMLSLPIPSGTLKQGIFLDANIGMSLMRELQKQMGVQTAYLAFSGQNAMVREIEMPSLNEKELTEAVYWEAEKVLPYPVDEAILDWIILDPSREAGQMMNLLLVAGKKDYIRTFLKPLKAVGIQPMNLSLFPMPILQILQYIPEYKSHATVAVVDMGAEATHVLIIKDGLPRLSRTIPSGGNDFTENVASSFSIPFDEAERVKLEYGTLESKETDWSQLDLMSNPYMGVSEVLSSIAQDVFGEIKRSFVHFQLHNRGQLIEKVYLTGGSSQLDGMAEGLAKHLNVPVDPLDVSAYIPFAPELREQLQVEGSFMMEALGLALSGV